MRERVCVCNSVNKEREKDRREIKSERERERKRKTPKFNTDFKNGLNPHKINERERETYL